MNYRDKVDTERCYFCPKRNGIEVHHIVPQRFRGSDSRENLAALCDTCHGKLERLYDKSFYESLGVEDAPGERKTHFPCIRDCSDRAAKKIRMPQGTINWFCETHATEVIENFKGELVEAEIVSEVDE